jgi:hypothetical protein
MLKKSINVKGKVKLSLCLRTALKICGEIGNIASSIPKLGTRRDEWLHPH